MSDVASFVTSFVASGNSRMRSTLEAPVEFEGVLHDCVIVEMWDCEENSPYAALVEFYLCGNLVRTDVRCWNGSHHKTLLEKN